MLKSGVIIVRKERGMTSFAVVSRMRRIFGIRKIGHTGTLDPDAEGVLPVCLGKATRLAERFSHGTKRYDAVLRLGITTDTQDVSGAVLLQRPVLCTAEEAEACVRSFEGTMQQLPPMYSAIKVNGQKLSELARKGVEVERTPREVTFSEMEIRSIALPEIHFSVTCTHGAYIRTLCHDIGEKLGCGGAMASLLRTRVEDFELKDALTLSELEERKAEEERAGIPADGTYSFLIPVDRFFSDMPKAVVADTFLKKALSGVPVPKEQLVCPEGADPFPEQAERVRLYDERGCLIGLYRKKQQTLKLEQYFYEGDSVL